LSSIATLCTRLCLEYLRLGNWVISKYSSLRCKDRCILSRAAKLGNEAARGCIKHDRLGTFPTYQSIPCRSLGAEQRLVTSTPYKGLMPKARISGLEVISHVQRTLDSRFAVTWHTSATATTFTCSNNRGNSLSNQSCHRQQQSLDADSSARTKG
jgi:hypothetical protein